MRLIGFSFALLSASVLFCGTVSAECLQANALYSDRDQTMQIEFLSGDSGMSSNAFKIQMENALELDGFVFWNNGVARPNGIVMHQCPEGDVTGDELAACTIWEGVVYTVDGTGDVDLLPHSDEPAAERLLLPDFGRAVRYSSLSDLENPPPVPWDVVEFKSCRE